MAVDAFLKMDGIKGESVVEGHKEEIDVLSWSWGMSQSGTAHFGGGAGGGKVNVQDLHITKRVDSSSHLLHQFCCNGKPIKTGTLIMRKAGGTQLEYLKIVFEEVIVSSMNTSGQGESTDLPTESLSLNFARFKYSYQPQGPDGGKKGGALEAAYDIAKVK